MIQNIANIARLACSTLAFRPLAAVIAIAALAAAFAFSAPRDAQAQDDSYVDLVVTNDYDSGQDSELNIFYVHNFGTAEARGVTVSFVLDKLQAWYGTSMQPPPSDVTNITKAGGRESFTWLVGNIPAGGTSRNVLRFATVRNTTEPAPTSFPFYLIGSIRAEASANTFEPPGLRTNNVRTVYAFSGTAGLSGHMVDSRLALFLSVDNLGPTSASPDVDFDLTAITLAPAGFAGTQYVGVIADVEISVELSEGLKFKEGWTAPDGFATSGFQSATWTPEDVSGYTSDTSGIDTGSRQIAIETTLTGDSLDAIPLEERCITARVVDSLPPPEPGYVLGSLKQCLGDDPPLLFEQGTLQAFTAFPCVNASGTATTSYPCGASDSTSEVAVIAVADSDALNPDPRLQGVGRSISSFGFFSGTVTLLPERGIFIQVKDPAARVVNGGAVTWQTGRKTGSGLGNKPVPGVVITYSVRDFVDTTSGSECPGTATCRWSNLLRTVKVKGLDQGSNPPGGVKVKINSSRETQHYDANSDNGYTSTRLTWDLGRLVSNRFTTYFLEFSTLGTHAIDFSAGVTRRSDSAVQQATSTYIFHVGPIAELEVRDGGRSPRVVAGQRAYTVMAVNNGPDAAPAVEVTLSGLDADSCAGSATKGSVAFTGGECAWTIGELETKEFHQGLYGRDGETLTIITSADIDTQINAAISNTQDYEVCIDDEGNDVDAASESGCTGTTGNTWHTTTYYDYISDNDSATIRAKDGTGADLPSAGGEQASAAIIVTWDAIDQVNGRIVTHYQVQRSADGESDWQRLADDVQAPMYVDTDLGAGETHFYRVRAVNDRGHEGLWSAPIVARTGGAEVAPGAPAGVSASASGGGAIEVSWGPPADNGGLDVSGYQARWSANGTSGWRNFGVQDKDARSYTHTGLAFGTERFYQVRARNGAGWGSWSATVSATTLAGVPATPNLTARATDASTIALSWTEPASNADPIIRYEIERSADGAAWSALTSTAASVRTHDDTGLQPGTTRHYRVRAVNGAGDGSWSTARSATTRVVAPGVPRGLAAAVDGENAIGLSWLAPEDDGGSAVTSYRLELRAVTAAGLGGASNRTVGASGALEYAHTGLTVGSTWQYRVRARNSAGWGEWSEPVRATTESGVAAAPGSFAARANGSSEIVLTWTEPDGRGERVQYYHIDWSADGSAGWSRLATVAADKTTHIDGGLQPGTKRYYRVRGRNFNGAGAWSATRHATTPANAPGAPTNLMATSTSDKAIDLSWTTPGGAGTAVNGYWVERSRDGSAPWRRVATLGAVTTYTDTRELYPGMKRHYRVAAVNSGGAGPWSNVASATTTTTTREAAAAPGWVDNLRFTSVGSTSVGLAWSAPPDTGGAPVTGYRYQVTGPSGAREPGVLGSGARSVTITGLNEEGGYVFAVWAVNAVGDGLAEWLTTDLAGR